MERSKRNLQNYFFTFSIIYLLWFLLRRSNLGIRFKYHYYNEAKLRNFLGFFLKTFGWTSFAITVIEVCPKDKLGVAGTASRENWFLSKYQPILNVLKSSGEEPLLACALELFHD